MHDNKPKRQEEESFDIFKVKDGSNIKQWLLVFHCRP